MEADIETSIDCFIDAEHTVISFEGENYYKSCGVPVVQYPLGGASHCVRRVGHTDGVHEDWDGNTSAYQPTIEGV